MAVASNNLAALTAYLSAIPVGAISVTTKLDRLLAACWEEFEGGNVHGMDGYKLIDRMEVANWNPPQLSFTIERHGGTVMGSTRAEVHNWIVNVAEKTTRCAKATHRQVSPVAPRLDVRALAEEISRLIITRQIDSRVKWNSDGSVRVQISMILPQRSAVKQTLTGRRRRLLSQLDLLLANAGWAKVGDKIYMPPASQSQQDRASFTRQANS